MAKRMTRWNIFRRVPSMILAVAALLNVAYGELELGIILLSCSIILLLIIPLEDTEKQKKTGEEPAAQ